MKLIVQEWRCPPRHDGLWLRASVDVKPHSPDDGRPEYSIARPATGTAGANGWRAASLAESTTKRAISLVTKNSKKPRAVFRSLMIRDHRFWTGAPCTKKEHAHSLTNASFKLNVLLEDGHRRRAGYSSSSTSICVKIGSSSDRPSAGRKSRSARRIHGIRRSEM